MPFPSRRLLPDAFDPSLRIRHTFTSMSPFSSDRFTRAPFISASGRAALLFVVAGLLALRAAEPIRVLTIGSSFAENATEFLSQIGESRGVPIIVVKANLGAADVARHDRHFQAALKNSADPEGKPYWDRADPAQRHYSLIDKLTSAKWDYVTIQQFTGDSDKPETYEPYAAHLIAAVHKYAPSARMIVHQTWAYRADHPLFFSSAPERQTAEEKLRFALSSDKLQRPVPITPEAMYQGSRDAYDQLAARYRLLLVPVGDAFHIAEGTPEWHYVPDPKFDYAHPVGGTAPDQSKSLIGGWHWAKNKQTGVVSFALDAKHANVAGKYLGACVFFESLTGQDARKIEWRPEGLAATKAESLRNIAHEAVAARKEAGTFDFALPERRQTKR